MNRYSYTLNNPIRYIDPTGHVSCSGANWDDGPQCVGKQEFKDNVEKEKQVIKIRNKFKHVTIKNFYNWDLGDLKDIYTGLNNIMDKNGFNGNMDAFNTVFGSVTFALHHFSGTQAGGSDWDRNTGAGVIRIDTDKSDWTTVVHEMGHLFSWTYKRELKNDSLPSYAQMYPNIFTAGTGATGYARHEHSPGEDFADSFLAVIEYGPKEIIGRGVDQSRLNLMTALIQSYTTPDLPGGR